MKQIFKQYLYCNLELAQSQLKVAMSHYQLLIKWPSKINHLHLTTCKFRIVMGDLRPSCSDVDQKCKHVLISLVYAKDWTNRFEQKQACSKNVYILVLKCTRWPHIPLKCRFCSPDQRVVITSACTKFYTSAALLHWPHLAARKRYQLCWELVC